MAEATNHREVGGLKQQTFILLVWRPEVQKQGVGRAMLSLKCLGGGSVSVASAAGGSRDALVFLVVPVSSPTVTWTSTLGVLFPIFFFFL